MKKVNVHMLAGDGAVQGLVVEYVVDTCEVSSYPAISPIKERAKEPIVTKEVVERKTTDSEVEAARARYLARKKARRG